MKKKQINSELEEEAPLPFSSQYVIDYFDKIEEEFEKQSKIRGRISKERRDYINSLIDDCEKLRRKYLPKSDKSRIYEKI